MNDEDSHSECQGCLDLQQNLDNLRRLLDAQAGDHRREVAALQADRARERAAQDAAARDLIAQVGELVAALEG